MAEPKKRILVVDDSTELQEFFRVVLQDAGYEVSTAASGEEALAKVKALRPDLILLDLVMPGMDGLEFLSRLRSDFAPPIPPSILCSGFDLTEQEALRRGALMFVRKPIAPADLLEFVALGLLGERVSAETAARERANSAEARSRTRQAASAFVSRIRRDLEQKAAGQMAWLAAYFGLGTALIALMEDERLTVVAAAGDPMFAAGLNLSRKLYPCYEILESSSSLVLADASTHACFSSGPYRLEGVGFFAGVPLMAQDGIPIGVVCVLDQLPRRTSAEDLLILEQFGRQGSQLLRLLATGRPESELPGRLGPGMLLRPSLEVLLDAELRLLRHSGGSMELAVVEMDDPQQMREAVVNASNRERLAAGELGPNRVAVYKRDAADGAPGQIRTLLTGLGATTRLRGVGAAAIAGSHLPAIVGQDLLHLAELELEQALQTDGGKERLVLQHEAG